MHRIVVPTVAFALVLGLVGPMAVHAEIISVPPADPPNTAASLPPADPPNAAASLPPADPANAAASLPPADPPNATASLPPPTVLRGSPLATARSVPICPPRYMLSSDYDYGCVAPSAGDYTESSPGYDYWPDYGYGYPFGGYPGFGFGAGRFDRFAGFHGGRGFHGRAAFHGQAGFHGDRGFHGQAGFHGRAAFHSAARFGTPGAGIGHMGGFGRR